MTYQNFIEQTIEEISPSFDAGTDIRAQTITKNNGLNPMALIISEPNNNIFPTIYLDEYYERAKKGEDIKKLSSDILDVYHKHKIDGQMDISCLGDFSKISSRVILRLVNKKQNEKLLLEIPWEEYLDLALIACIYYDTPAEIYAGSIISNNHIQMWNIKKELLFEEARNNLPSLLPAKIKSFPDFFKEEMEIDAPALENQMDDNPQMNMHILTNNVNTHGAVCMTYPNIIKEYADSVKSNVFIIPSSIHEVLLLPQGDNSLNMAELSDLVKEVNQTHVSPGDYLSDHVYLYHREKNSISY